MKTIYAFCLSFPIKSLHGKLHGTEKKTKWTNIIQISNEKCKMAEYIFTGWDKIAKEKCQSEFVKSTYHHQMQYEVKHLCNLRPRKKQKKKKYIYVYIPFDWVYKCLFNIWKYIISYLNLRLVAFTFTTLLKLWDIQLKIGHFEELNRC